MPPKKTQEKPVKKLVKKPVKKPVKKISKNETSDESIESESESESETEKSIDDFDVTETKITEFFSDDDSVTNTESDTNECKTEIFSDTVDPAEQNYNNLISKKKLHEYTIVNKEDRITNPRMTKYEMVRIIGERTKQLIMGAKALVKNTDDLTYEEIAVLELHKNMTPFKIKRPLPNNSIEIWELSELKKDHLEV
jgi:DNA-directed RNA polymerase subunit K/omega